MSNDTAWNPFDAPRADPASPPPAGPYRHVVARGPLVFTAGQVGRALDGELHSKTVEGQTVQALVNLQAALASGGAELKDVLSVTVHLAHEEDFGAMNEQYKQFFLEPYPARTTVVAGLRAGALVEFTAVAWRIV